MVDECQICGACCFSDSSAYVPLTAEDRARLATYPGVLVHEEAGGHYMVMRGGHCAALQVMGGRFVCSVYSARPDVCRELERGSPECREERLLKKLVALRCAS